MDLQLEVKLAVCLYIGIALSCFNITYCQGANAHTITTTPSPQPSDRQSQHGCDYRRQRPIAVYPDPNSTSIAGTVTFSHASDNSLLASCNGELFGSREILCENNRVWSPSAIVCFKPVECQPIDHPMNGQIIGVKQSYGIFDTIQFRCNSKYSLIGPPSAYCRPNSQWSERPPKCRGLAPLRCVQPDVGSSVVVDPRKESYEHGSVVRFSCRNGLALLPVRGFNDTSTCIDGEWRPDSAECYEISTGVVIRPSNYCTRSIYTQHVIRVPARTYYPPGKSVYYSCEAGYYLSGHEVRTCGGTSTWDPQDAPECADSPTYCLPPNVAGNIDVLPNIKRYKDRTTIVLMCGRNAVTATCVGGQWDRIPPICSSNGDHADTTDKTRSDAPDVNDDIDVILQDPVANETVARQLKDVANATRMYEELTAQSVELVVDFLEEATKLGISNQEITDDLVETINNLIGVSEAALLDSNQDTNATNRALDSLTRQLNIVDTSVTFGIYTARRPNLDVTVLDLQLLQLLNGITFATHDDNLTDIYFNLSAAAAIGMMRVNASVTLPYMPKTKGSNDTDVRLSFTAHKRASLFASLWLDEFNSGAESGRRMSRRPFQRVPSRPVISAQVRSTDGELPHELINITTSFPISMASGRIKSTRCVHWDFEANNRSGDWSTDGCRPVPSIRRKGVLVCQCRRLANFNILLDVYDDNYLPIEIQYFLYILTYVGCSVSACGLILTIVAYASSKKLRNKQPNQILLCLMATLLALNITLIISLATLYHMTDERMRLPIPCAIQGALLHFLTLSALCWMGVEGMNVYLLLVRVINAYIPRFVRRAAIFAWGGPGVVTLIMAAAFRGDYVRMETCFLNTWPQVIGVLVPAGLLLVFNTVIFVAVVRSIGMTRSGSRSVNRSASTSNSSTDNTSAEMSARYRHRIWRLRSAFFVMLLLGLTWVFGFLGSVPNVAVSSAFHVIFTLLNAFQGFLIFVIYCLYQPVVRKQLFDHVLGCVVHRAVSVGRAVLASSSSSSAAQDQNKSVQPSVQSASTTEEYEHVQTKSTPVKMAATRDKGAHTMEMTSQTT